MRRTTSAPRRTRTYLACLGFIATSGGPGRPFRGPPMAGHVGWCGLHPTREPSSILFGVAAWLPCWTPTANTRTWKARGRGQTGRTAACFSPPLSGPFRHSRLTCFLPSIEGSETRGRDSSTWALLLLLARKEIAGRRRIGTASMNLRQPGSRPQPGWSARRVFRASSDARRDLIQKGRRE